MNRLKERGMQAVFLLSACVSIIAVALICIYLFANGFPAIKEIGVFKFLFGTEWNPDREVFGIFPMILGSIYVTAGAVLLGVPVALLCAIFMARYCPPRLYKIFKPVIELLAGIPSIVYGFFGLVVIVPAVRELFGGGGKGILSASVLLAMMIIPTITEVAESSLRAVPESYYEGALALGATKERSIFSVLAPAAKPGLLASVILGIGRAIGETMAVVIVAGNQAIIPDSLVSGVRTMTSNIVLELAYSEPNGLHRRALIATAVVLFVFILIIDLSFSAVKHAGEGTRIGKAKAGAANAGKAVSEAFTAENTATADICTGTQAAASAGAVQAPVRTRRSLPLSETFERLRKRSLELRLPSRLEKFAVIASAVLCAAIILFIIGYISIMGIPNLKPSLFAWKYTTENMSMMPSIINTVVMVILTLIISVPLGVFTAIYLTEYARRGSIFVKAVRVTTETLQGIPSIVFGLFGFIVLVNTLHFDYSMLAGVITLSIMVLPLIIRTSEEALASVPDSYREGAFGLGAGKLRVVFRVVLPSALPGIFSGIVLAVGRIVGESAALLLTSGTGKTALDGIMMPARTISVHLYCLLNEGLYMEEAYATAFVLLLLVVAINLLSGFIAGKIRGKSGDK